MYETSHRLRKYQCFFSSGPLHYCNGAYFLEMAHNFGNPGAIGPYACFAFPISVLHIHVRFEDCEMVDTITVETNRRDTINKSLRKK